MSDLSAVTSADGTTIAYEKLGAGPAIIVVSNVAEDHTGVAGVAEALSEHFTVITFDRRGRGASGDPQPYDPAREIDDIAALVEIAGGSAALTSGSGGSGLTLDAASALGDKITGLSLYEPPFIVDDSRSPAPADYVEHQEALPTDRWTIESPIAVAVGGNGEPFIRTGAEALAKILPNVTVLTLPDQDHSAFWMAPVPVAEQARAFLQG